MKILLTFQKRNIAERLKSRKDKSKSRISNKAIDVNRSQSSFAFRKQKTNKYFDNKEIDSSNISKNFKSISNSNSLEENLESKIGKSNNDTDDKYNSKVSEERCSSFKVTQIDKQQTKETTNNKVDFKNCELNNSTPTRFSNWLKKLKTPSNINQINVPSNVVNNISSNFTTGKVNFN